MRCVARALTDGLNASMAKKTLDATKAELPVRSFRSPAAWEKWLAANHESSIGVRIKFAKKASGIASVYYKEALDVALCHGWIDGQVKSLDENFYLQRFTPRRERSQWSKINCGHAMRLIECGRMRPAGLKQIEAAKADGRWVAAYDSPRNAKPPDDLLMAFKKSPKARKAFESLTSQNRYAILYRVQNAKRAVTRARWVEKCVRMLEAGEKFHP
jgi:uncharacterized protein YdeI (YjbR/CyaY-like superfamily)